MKLDVTCMRYLTKEDYRVLVAVEMGMRNHEMVPVHLITSIAQLRHGGSYRILSTLLRYKLVAHALQEYDGYRLSYLGYDILALHTLQARGVIVSVGNQIGVGKESDIFEAMDPEGNELIIKIHRLGRTSFRAVRKNRDYMLGKSKSSWLYMSRLAAVKEYAFMRALHAHGFPVPTPIDHNRHVVAMSRIDGFPLAQTRSGRLETAPEIFAVCLSILRRLAEHGLVHCDFNEFNLLLSQDTGDVTLIDFPQMVSTSHENASELLQRDINCLIKFFAMKMKYVPPDEALFSLDELLANSVDAVRIDEEVRASGFEGEEDLVQDLLLDLHRRRDDDGHSGGEEDNEDNDEDGDLEDLDRSGEIIHVEEPDQEPQEESEDIIITSSELAQPTLAADDNNSNIQLTNEQQQLAIEARLAAAQARLRTAGLKKAKGKGHGHRGAGGKETGRNHTKKRNKYGKIVKNNDLSDW